MTERYEKFAENNVRDIKGYNELMMLNETPDILPFLIFSVYSFMCIVFAYFEAQRLYKKQNETQISV